LPPLFGHERLFAMVSGLSQHGGTPKPYKHTNQIKLMHRGLTSRLRTFPFNAPEDINVHDWIHESLKEKRAGPKYVPRWNLDNGVFKDVKLVILSYHPKQKIHVHIFWEFSIKLDIKALRCFCNKIALFFMTKFLHFVLPKPLAPHTHTRGQIVCLKCQEQCVLCHLSIGLCAEEWQSGWNSPSLFALSPLDQWSHCLVSPANANSMSSMVCH
jgi:hypothetical protein